MYHILIGFHANTIMLSTFSIFLYLTIVLVYVSTELLVTSIVSIEREVVQECTTRQLLFDKPGSVPFYKKITHCDCFILNSYKEFLDPAKVTVVLTIGLTHFEQH